MASPVWDTNEICHGIADALAEFLPDVIAAMNAQDAKAPQLICPEDDRYYHRPKQVMRDAAGPYVMVVAGDADYDKQPGCGSERYIVKCTISVEMHWSHSLRVDDHPVYARRYAGALAAALNRYMRSIGHGSPPFHESVTLGAEIIGEPSTEDVSQESRCTLAVTGTTGPMEVETYGY